MGLESLEVQDQLHGAHVFPCFPEKFEFYICSIKLTSIPDSCKFWYKGSAFLFSMRIFQLLQPNRAMDRGKHGLSNLGVTIVKFIVGSSEMLVRVEKRTWGSWVWRLVGVVFTWKYTLFSDCAFDREKHGLSNHEVESAKFRVGSLKLTVRHITPDEMWRKHLFSVLTKNIELKSLEPKRSSSSRSDLPLFWEGIE